MSPELPTDVKIVEIRLAKIWIVLGVLNARQPCLSPFLILSNSCRTRPLSMVRTRSISPMGTSSAPGSPRKRPASPMSIPVLQSPKKRRRAKAEKSDLEVWDESENDIIEASKARWTSAVYDHYETSLRRHTKADGSPNYLEFVFKCRTDPANHRPHHRKRMQTGQGTKNLKQGLIECAARRGVSTSGANSSILVSVKFILMSDLPADDPHHLLIHPCIHPHPWYPHPYGCG